MHTSLTQFLLKTTPGIALLVRTLFRASGAPTHSHIRLHAPTHANTYTHIHTHTHPHTHTHTHTCRHAHTRQTLTKHATTPSILSALAVDPVANFAVQKLLQHTQDKGQVRFPLLKAAALCCLLTSCPSQALACLTSLQPKFKELFRGRAGVVRWLVGACQRLKIGYPPPCLPYLLFSLHHHVCAGRQIT